MSQAKIYWDLDNYAQVEKASYVNNMHFFVFVCVLNKSNLEAFCGPYRSFRDGLERTFQILGVTIQPSLSLN